MFWKIPDFPVNTPMTDQDLEQYGILVDGFSITWENKTYQPRFHNVLSKNVGFYRNFPVCVGLYKLEDLWYYIPRLKIVSLSAGQTLTVWRFPYQGDGIEGVVYRATADENAFDPEPQEFIVDDYGSYVNIIGVKHYCERLHIPAAINGLPVRKAYITADYRTENIRLLSADEGVEQLYFDFQRCHSLTTITLPPSLKLMTPPDGIRRSPWYQNQSGCVYLQNWYCGFSGSGHPDTLTVQDGTYGILAGADARAPWRVIDLPESLCYLGEDAFRHCSPARFYIPDSCAQWNDRIIPRPLVSVLPPTPMPSGEPPKEPVLNCPRDLYELGRSDLVRGFVPAGFEPLAPRLSYHEHQGWLAEYWYCTEDAKTVGYYVKLRLCDGRPLMMHAFEHFYFGTALWTEDYVPPFYRFSEEYLSDCLRLMSGDAPTKDQLSDLKDLWHRSNPNAFNSWLSYTPQPYDLKGAAPYPITPTKEKLAFWSWDRVKRALSKEVG